MGVRGNLLGVAAIACTLFALDRWASSRALVPADVANESDFYRVYNPVPLMNPLRAGCASWAGVTTGASTGPGSRFPYEVRPARYTRIARSDLCDETHYSSMLNTLHRDLLAELHYFGCPVLRDDFSPGEKARIMYHCGTRTSGSITTGAPGRYLTLEVDEEWSSQ